MYFQFTFKVRKYLHYNWSTTPSEQGHHREMLPPPPWLKSRQVLENKLKPNQVCLPTLFVLSDAAAPNVDKCASFQLKLPKLM